VKADHERPHQQREHGDPLHAAHADAEPGPAEEQHGAEEGDAAHDQRPVAEPLGPVGQAERGHDQADVADHEDQRRAEEVRVLIHVRGEGAG